MIAAGTRLGVYEVRGPLGAGGMGEVYRATDTRLGREVALKVLSETFAGDPDRLMRFEREARTLATLNHPHIAQIYGVEETRGSAGDVSRALIMELVEGETLADRIAAGALPIDEAIAIARQVAEALEAAHGAGIIHRDLKPANIKVRPDDTVKVLDFGLAKASAAGSPHRSGVDAEAGATGAMTSPAITMQGMILGTAAYMSPEQAKGRPVDARADLWAFGCVLYEMLTGRRAFPGEDVSETLASILAREPDLQALPPALPSSVRTLIARCLARDPKQRVASASTALYVLTGTLDTAGSEAAIAGTSQPRTAPVARPIWRRALPALATALVAGLIGIAAGQLWQPPPARAVTRFSFTLPPGLVFTNNNRRLLDVSPDGSRIAYVAGLRLYIRDLAESEARPIPGSDVREGVLHPVFSPDGAWLAFWTGRSLRKVPVGGGTPVTLYTDDSPTASFGLSWDESGIVFSASPGILRTSPEGGEAALLVGAREGEGFHGPQLLPGGRHVLYTVAPGNSFVRDANEARVVIQTLGTDHITTLVQAVDGRYLPTGHLLYRSAGTMMAVRFDVERLATIGSAVPVTDAAVSSGAVPLATHLVVSASGTLAYVAGSGSSGQDIAVLNRRGQIEKRLGLPEGAYATPRVSPDGRHVAYSDRATDPNIWIAALDGSALPRRLTFRGRNRFPVWTADGRYLAFESDRDGDGAIFWQRADGSSDAERLTTPAAGTTHAPEAFSPDGQHLLIRVSSGPASSLWWWSRTDRSLRRIEENEPNRASNATFSPDGKWIVYSTQRRTGSVSVVRPFPLTPAQYEVPIPEKSANMAIHPVWSRTTSELIYSAGPGLLASAPIKTGSAVEFGVPTVVQIPGTGDVVVRSWDVTPDGQHIIRIIERDQEGAPTINVVLNWSEELKQRLPAR